MENTRKYRDIELIRLIDDPDDFHYDRIEHIIKYEDISLETRSLAMEKLAYLKELKLVKLLLKKGVTNQSKSDTLYWAWFRQNHTIVELLLKYAPIGNQFERSLIYACYTGLDDTIELLLEDENEISQKDINDGFVMAASRGYYKIIQLLIDKIDDDNNLRQGLVEAVNHRHIKLVRYFIDYGVKLDYYNDSTDRIAAEFCVQHFNIPLEEIIHLPS